MLLPGFLVIIIYFLGVQSASVMENFPTAHTKNNRILAFVLHYSYDHIDPLMVIMGEYVSMCEGGWSPTVVLHTTSNWTETMHRYMRQHTYCYRTGSFVLIPLSTESIHTIYLPPPYLHTNCLI